MARNAKPRRVADTIRVSGDTGEFTFKKRFAALQVVQGADIDLGKHVLCDRPIALGREEGLGLPLSDGSISRRHCIVERDARTGQYTCRDLDSTNGTRVNGRKLEAPVPLSEGDKIHLGASIVKFTFSDAVDLEFTAKMDEMVTTDALTGLLNKRPFDAAFEQATRRAQQDGQALCVLVMDMDGLKQINDTHGHEMGGFAITEAAKIIREVVAHRGETCRFGGDEFITYLPDTSKTDGSNLAEVIRDRVALHMFELADVRVAPTISIGVAAMPDDGGDPDALFRAADAALYQAKAAGRNQVCVA